MESNARGQSNNCATCHKRVVRRSVTLRGGKLSNGIRGDTRWICVSSVGACEYAAPISFAVSFGEIDAIAAPAESFCDSETCARSAGLQTGSSQRTNVNFDSLFVPSGPEVHLPGQVREGRSRSASASMSLHECCRTLSGVHHGYDSSKPHLFSSFPFRLIGRKERLCAADGL
ncbi:hypothetical protein EYF80_035552 [Liparis tanakae]|uniref:Uncharacterized protein n=1 Tax=Liparis tanakae TaxID=230148 RepID=A0A4Z2GNL6_9TELE|nr:hypothetical protein EYF80_035552 [Liparis tanakae]